MIPTYQRTKIIATIGPASNSYEMLEKIMLAGVDVCRLNMSHGNLEDHVKVINHIKAINEKHGMFVGVLADLQGPKIRTGEMHEGKMMLDDGELVTITNQKMEGKDGKFSISYNTFPMDAKPNDLILIDDGKLHLKVVSTDNKCEVKAKVLHGGVLKSRKGVNLPNTKINMPSLTNRDKENLKAILDYQIDWVALSFVRSAEDIVDLRQQIEGCNPVHIPRVIAKIEKPEALEEIDQIIKETDAIMVARGDLGVEIPMQQVPLIQKNIVKKCLENAKPVIIATQMMESMITNVTPTRAEVNDVANSVMDGADAVMLSGETSVGEFPVKVVDTMQKIIERIEEYEGIYHRSFEPIHNEEDRFVSNAICCSACGLAENSGAQAIVTMTHSGYTAFIVSSYRPKANIFVFTDNKSILTTLSLIWGVRGFYYNGYESTDRTIEDIKQSLKEKGLLKENDLVVNIASMPIKDKGKTNMLKLSTL